MGNGSNGNNSDNNYGISLPQGMTFEEFYRKGAVDDKTYLALRSRVQRLNRYMHQGNFEQVDHELGEIGELTDRLGLEGGEEFSQVIMHATLHTYANSHRENIDLPTVLFYAQKYNLIDDNTEESVEDSRIEELVPVNQ